ncbi:hypothetical protein LLG95_16685 [bacterium]|nr:hypothetical protein [bacterium]
MKRFIFTTCLLGSIFLLSSIAKAIEVQSFAMLISYFNIIRNPTLVTAIAIFIISIEFLLGLVMIISKHFRVECLKLSLAILIFFTGIIVYGWLFKGLEDCGCFGSFIKISPIASIIKNVIMIGMNVIAISGASQSFQSQSFELDIRSKKLQTACAAFCPLLLIASLAWSFWGGKPVKSDAGLAVAKPPTTTDRPFAQFAIKDDSNRALDLGKGIYFVGFMSDSCSHCQELVSRMNTLVKEFGELPVVGLILGEEDTLRQFREQFKPQFPMARVQPLKFFEFIGNAPPRFYLIHDGKSLRYWDDDLPKIDDIQSLLPDIF